ncbi:hypothetical protein LY625_06630 [Lysobacter sp. GX 14042]|uniref:hypothetical protein n=1 Tax=Lysobacter sp. GX 14042 TaxID=2907155 RepID=UPI001F180130|nr:hypothetical protein [Lysobacter sp. GX 14042]MCE7032297.1 hypothetical protein [Lysobacter sp. GX 14042]
MPHFDHTLVLPVAPSDWAPPPSGLVVDGVRLEPKDELHVTLVGGRLGAELRRTLGAQRASREVDAVFRRLDWSFSRTGRCLLLRKPFRDGGRQRLAHSVIECIEMPAMAPFHRALGQLLGRELPVPPSHVTLYVAGKDQGIGVPDRRRLRAWTVRMLGAGEPAPRPTAAAAHHG